MMKKLHFRDYAGVPAGAVVLTEGLTGVKDRDFPNIGMADAVRFLMFFPDWRDDCAAAELDLEFADSEHADRFFSFLDDIADQDLRKSTEDCKGSLKSTGDEWTSRVEFAPPDGLDDKAKDQYSSQMFATLMRAAKDRPETRKCLRRDGSGVVAAAPSADAAREAAAFAAAAAGNGDVRKGVAAAVANQAARKDPANKARAAELAQEGRKIGDALAAALAALPAPDPSAAPEPKIRRGRTTAVFKGDCERCAWAGAVARACAGAGSLADSRLREVPQPIWRKQFYLTRGLTYTKDAGQNVRIVGDLSERQRGLLRLFNKIGDKDWRAKVRQQRDAVLAKAEAAEGDAKAELRRQGGNLTVLADSPIGTPADALSWMLAHNFGISVVEYLKQRRLAEQEKNNPPPDLDKFGSVQGMFSAVESAGMKAFSPDADSKAQEAIDKVRRLEQAKYTDKSKEPQLADPVARRRFKLFKALLQRKGEVYSNADWTIGVCRNAKQLCVFGRNKPKCVAGDRKAIFAEANLEDWEGITPENKAIRDGSNLWVHDGINKTFDRLETETCWCVCGAYTNHGESESGQLPRTWGEYGRGYWSYEMPDSAGGTCLVQIMDHRNGALYMAGANYLLDEGDGHSGLASGSGSGQKCLARLCTVHQSLDQLMRDSGLYERIIRAAAPREATLMELVAKAASEGVLSPDGSLHIGDVGEASAYRRLIPYASKIYVEASNADDLFALNPPLETQLPTVNCRMVKSACRMFYQVESRDGIHLESTEGIEDMRAMFAGALTAEVTGLDTRSAKYIDDIFQNCRQRVFKMVSVPPLDLSRCVSMHDAFRSSYIGKLTFRNATGVKNAHDAFAYMPLLQSVPDIRFKNTVGRTAFLDDDAPRYAGVFRGCSTVFGTDDFEKSVAAIEKYYESHEGEVDLTDERGFLIVRSGDDVAAFAERMDTYPGVVVDKNANSECLFYEINGLQIKTLDLNGREDANRMFINCSNLTVKSIVGAENVRTANSMFAGSRFYVCPKLAFPNLTGNIMVFRGVHPFGNVNSKGLFSAGDKVEEFDLQDAADPGQQIIASLFGSTAGEWRQTPGVVEAVDSLYASIIDAKNAALAAKFKKGEDGFVEVSVDDLESGLGVALGMNPSGLRLSKESVDGLNSGGIRMNERPSGLWRRAKGKALPPIDLNGLVHADYLFMGLDCASLGGVIGVEGLTSAVGMFYKAKIQGSFPLAGAVFEKLAVADAMFDESVIAGLDASAMKFPALRSAECMFHNAARPGGPVLAGDFECGAVQCSCMFVGVDKGLGVRLGRLSFPNAEDVGSLLVGSGVREVAALEAPKARNAARVFANCGELTHVRRLDLRAASNAGGAFFQCKKLMCVNAFRLNESVQAADQMFSGSPLSQVFGEDGAKMFARSRLLNS